MVLLQEAEARKVALDKEQAALRNGNAQQTQRLLDLQATTKTLSSELEGAQKQRSQMLDALKRLALLVRLFWHVRGGAGRGVDHRVSRCRSAAKRRSLGFAAPRQISEGCSGLANRRTTRRRGWSSHW